MKPTKEQIDLIKSKFSAMQTSEDLLDLLNFSKSIIYGEKVIPFKLKDITFYCNPKRTIDHNWKFFHQYQEFTIAKKSGGTRTIYAPKKGLKAVQRSIAFAFQCIFEPHKSTMGFTKERSIVHNAQLHINSHYVLNIDLKDFFPSVDQARVWKCLQLAPFNLNEATSRVFETFSAEEFSVKYPEQSKKIKTTKKFIICDFENNYFKASNRIPKAARLELANMLAAICSTEMDVEAIQANGSLEVVRKNVLPQGAPTSPILSNIVCQKLDLRLAGLAKRFGLLYSRYADDITFSSLHNVYQNEGEFNKELARIIADQGFRINEKKTRLQKDGYKKEVTGLLVHGQVNVQKRYIKELRMWLNLWERYGYEKSNNIFLKENGPLINTLAKIKKAELRNTLEGKLNYLSMVKGQNNMTYVKLNSRFRTLKPTIKIHTEDRSAHIEKTLELLLNKGINDAMAFYKPQ
jgi:RNA-directed DNA polymerase